MCLPIKLLQENWKKTHQLPIDVSVKYTTIEPHLDIVELLDGDWCQNQMDNILMINREFEMKLKPARFIGLERIKGDIQHPCCYPIISTCEGDVNMSRVSFRIINRFLMSQILSHVVARIVMNDDNYINFFKYPVQIESSFELFKTDKSQLLQFDRKCECTSGKSMTIISYNENYYLIDTALLACLHFIKINQWLLKEILIEEENEVIVTEFNNEKLQKCKQIWGVASSKVGTRVMFDLKLNLIKTDARTIKLSINFEFDNQVKGHTMHMFTLGGTKVRAIFRAIEPVVSAAAVVSTDFELFKMTMELLKFDYNDDDVEMLTFMMNPDIIKKALLFKSDPTVENFSNLCDCNDMKIQFQSLLKKDKLEMRQIAKAFCDKEMQIIHFDDYCFIFSVLVLSNIECFGNWDMSIDVGNGHIGVEHMIDLNILAKSMLSYYRKFIDHDVFSFKFVDFHYQFN